MLTDQTHTPKKTYHQKPIKQIQTISQLIQIIAKTQ